MFELRLKTKWYGPLESDFIVQPHPLWNFLAPSSGGGICYIFLVGNRVRNGAAIFVKFKNLFTLQTSFQVFHSIRILWPRCSVSSKWFRKKCYHNGSTKWKYTAAIKIFLVCTKSPGVALGLANVRTLGHAKFVNALPPGLNRHRNTPQLPRECMGATEIIKFWIKNYRWIQTLTTHSYRVSLNVK